MRRWVTPFVVVAAGMSIGAAAVFWMTRVDSAPPRVAAPEIGELAPEAETPFDLARAGCVRLHLATQAIRADADAETVRREMAGARILATEAARRSGRYAALSGGIAALDEALRRDQPEAARLGLRVALAECEPLTG